MNKSSAYSLMNFYIYMHPSNHLEKDMTDNPLQYSCLENSMDRGAWWAQSMGVAKVRHNRATKQQQSNHHQDPEIGHLQPLRGSQLWCKGHCVLSRFIRLSFAVSCCVFPACSPHRCLEFQEQMLGCSPVSERHRTPVLLTSELHYLMRRRTPTGGRRKSVTTPRYQTLSEFLKFLG